MAMLALFWRTIFALPGVLYSGPSMPILFFLGLDPYIIPSFIYSFKVLCSPHNALPAAC